MMFATTILSVLTLAGCSVLPPVNTAVAVTTGSSGQVIGGRQPVANSSIQLYTVGTTGDGTNATPLLTKPVTTDANGNFSISGLYSCTNATEVYLTAIGGDPGPGVTNPNLAMMTALGSCTSLSPTTPIVVNELTTVAAVNALTPYMTSYTAVGSGESDSGALNAAFTTASELVNPTTGVSPGPNVPSGYVVPTEEIDTLGDIMTPCVNSGGGTAGDDTPCGNFFSLATPPGSTPPSNTITALLYLAKNPGQNTAALYQLLPTAPPFQPQVSGMPSSFAIAVVPAIVPTILNMNPTSIAFPATAPGSASSAQETTLTNGGTIPVSISNITLTGAESVNFVETNQCPSTLAAGASCTIQTSFVPQSTASAGATIEVNGGAASVALSGAVESSAWPTTLLAAKPSVYLNFNDDTTNFLDQISGLTFSSGGGTVTPRQPGFDKTLPSNTSAGFAWNAYNKAPNNTLGVIEWDVPWTMLLHIDRLNWNRSGTLVLASKGDLASSTWWKLTLGMSGSFSQLCFTRSGAGISYFAQNGICTGYLDALPNGFNYDIVVEDSGSGSGSSLGMYINGLNVRTYIPGASFSNSYVNGFGYVTLSVTGGTGYAAKTEFTSTGGGPNCVVAGEMYATNGVPSTVATPVNLAPGGYGANTGCTSVPTIVLTSPTGTGAVITATLSGASMNSTKYPLMVPGYVSGGSYYGVEGTNAAAPPVNIDEFAIFPGNLNLTQVQTLFSQTKFYQGLTQSLSAPVPVLVFDDDAGGDLDNFFALQMAIALHQQGYVNLAGAVIEDQSVTCEATWRQMLDQAGLVDVPLSVPSTFKINSGTGFCTTANVNTYDPSTPLSNAAWESSATMYRTLFAKYSTTPIDIVSGGPMTAIAEFMQSPADSISPLTGLQLMAQNAANGGAIYAQGGGCNSSASPATTPCTGGIGGNLAGDYPSAQYVLSHNGTLPIYWIGGTPQSAGPGVLLTRTSKDPMFLLTTTAGTDVRSCWDCLPVEAVVSSYFYAGVQIGYRGGTGYANSTPFTLSGGGPDCEGSGFMTASGGVPNGIEFRWGASAVGSYSGIGAGCKLVPTVNLIGGTGTGVTLTAYPQLVCGTDTVGQNGGDSFTSAICSNQYTSPMSAYANQSPVSGAVMEWFINSLVDPIP
jgi:hypothetical protein